VCSNAPNDNVWRLKRRRAKIENVVSYSFKRQPSFFSMDGCLSARYRAVRLKQQQLTVDMKSTWKHCVRQRYATRIASIVLGVWLPFVGATGNLAATTTLPKQQQKPSASTAAKVKQARAWRVRVATTANPVTLRLRAKDALLSEVAAEIGRQLRIPVTLSPDLQDHRVTLALDDVVLETALQSLAPQAYLDYVIIGGGYGQPPRYKAIYLHAPDEPAPSPDAGFGNSIGITMIEGDTNDLDDAAKPQSEPKEVPVSVRYADNKLTVRARRQPLLVVLYEIANAVNIPLDPQLESGQLVDVDFKDYDLEQSVRSLPPKAQLYLRMDLRTMMSTPLRFVLSADNLNEPLKEKRTGERN
jgi:hypothetical protein